MSTCFILSASSIELTGNAVDSLDAALSVHGLTLGSGASRPRPGRAVVRRIEPRRRVSPDSGFHPLHKVAIASSRRHLDLEHLRSQRRECLAWPFYGITPFSRARLRA